MARQLMLVVAALSILLCGLASGLGARQPSTADVCRYQDELGPNLDAYTQKGGEGRFNRSDAYGPHERLVLQANVTFSGWPEQNKEVAFELDFPNGTMCAIFYNRTDEEGVAWIGCQLPYPCSDMGPDGAFGNWTALALTDVAGIAVMDIVEFEYGWLVEVLSIQTGWHLCKGFVPENAFCKQDPLDVMVEVKTIVCKAMSVTLSVVALDDLGETFSCVYVNYTAAWRAQKDIHLTLGSIPEWISVGLGAIWVNALAAPPQQGGSVLCPEIQKNILLLEDKMAVVVPRDFSTIQDAILRSHCGTTILVSPGVYYEHLSVNKPVLLAGLGLGDAILDGKGEGIGIDVISPYVSIIGLMVRNFSIGVCFRHTTHNTFYHNNFEDNGRNLLLSVTCDACLNASANVTWDNGCEGSYWSNYNGTDVNGDGVGDTHLPWEGVDSFPLANLLWNIADIDHDMDVDIFDVVKCAGAFPSTSMDLNWDPHCDIAESYGEIDIFDIVALASSYGERYSP